MVSTSMKKRIRSDSPVAAPFVSTAQDVALLRAVLTLLPHRAMPGHVLESWQQVAERAMTDNGGESISGEMCKHRYVALLAMARHKPRDHLWPVSEELRELLAAALVEHTQWEIETGRSATDSVAKRTRRAIAESASPLKTERLRSSKKPLSSLLRSYVQQQTVMQTALQCVAGRLETLERGALRDVAKDREAETRQLKREIEELQCTVSSLVSSLLSSNQAQSALEEQLTLSQASAEASQLKNEQLQSELQALSAKMEETRKQQEVQRGEEVAALRHEIQRARDDHQSELAALREENEQTRSAFVSRIRELVATQQLHQNEFETHKNDEQARRICQLEEIKGNAERGQQQQREELLLLLRAEFTSQMQHHDDQLRSELNDEQRKRKELQASVMENSKASHAETQDRLLQTEHTLGSLCQELETLRDAQSSDQRLTQHQALDRGTQTELQLMELRQALEMERHERSRENAKLLRNIQHILTASSERQ